jgi:polyphenol oxidase
MPIETIISETDDETLADSHFYWRSNGDVKVLSCRPLEDAGFVNGFSTRLGGVSPFPSADLNLAGFNEDSAENIYENRRRFLAAFPADYKLATVWQVHSDQIKTVRLGDEIAESDEKYDAVVSNLGAILAGVKTADCVPVLLGDPRTGAFAAVHAGWRGTVQSIVQKAIASLSRDFGAKPESIVAAIGPAACGRRYEVGKDVMEQFAANFPDPDKYFRPTREGHALVDLHLANRDQLVSAGVGASNIYISSLCTMERPDLFFSYRLEKQKYGKTGRLMSVIGRMPEIT